MVPVRPALSVFALLTQRLQITMQKVANEEIFRDPQTICSIQ